MFYSFLHVMEAAHQLGIMFQLIYQLIQKTANFDEKPEQQEPLQQPKLNSPAVCVI